ncbi:Uncharacterised protein [Gordonia terrae]|nr:Uncharacterised protein [Clostridioides difficile]VTS54137.1 Uncharacterised protein [Gordonia terrae]
MKAVVMECRIRVCGSPGRVKEFVDRASIRARDAFPHPARCSIVVEGSDSLFLRRQWHRENDVDVFGVPEGRDVCFGFADSSGRLTVARLESLSRDILSHLEVDPWVSDDTESVPWILTLTTGADPRSRREIVTRHPSLEVRRPVLAPS